MFTRVSEEERETLFTPEHFTTSSDVEREKFVSLFCVLFPNTSTNDRRERESKSKKERKEEIQPKKRVAPCQKKIRLFLWRENQKIYRSARCEHFRHKTTHVL
jgi:hypothetical protein